MTADRPPPDIELTVTIKFTGSNALLQRIMGAVQRAVTTMARTAGIEFKVRYADIPGLKGINFGSRRNGQAGKIRDTLGGLGILTIDDLCGLHRATIRVLIGWVGLKNIRRSLYELVPSRALRGDDPQAFPTLIDSLDITDAIYKILMERGFRRIADIPSEVLDELGLRPALAKHYSEST